MISDFDSIQFLLISWAKAESDICTARNESNTIFDIVIDIGKEPRFFTFYLAGIGTSSESANLDGLFLAATFAIAKKSLTLAIFPGYSATLTRDSNVYGVGRQSKHPGLSVLDAYVAYLDKASILVYQF
jgi:hypothetical protein